MPKTNKRRTMHRKRTSQRKRKNAKKGGAKLGHGLSRHMIAASRTARGPPKDKFNYLNLHLYLQDQLGFYFSISNDNGSKNLVNPETNRLFGDSNNQIDLNGYYTSDDIVLPDVEHHFGDHIVLPINVNLNIGKIKDFLSDKLDNVHLLIFVTPNTYTNWGERTNPVIAIRGNCLHGDEELGTGTNLHSLLGIPVGSSNGWRSLSDNQPLYRANRELTNVFMPVL